MAAAQKREANGTMADALKRDFWDFLFPVKL